jgi:ArsR family transcriptional regulator
MTANRAASLSRALDVLAHPVRIQLLDVLARNEGQVCVCDLEAAVDVKQPTVSHHLKLMREAGLVETERRGVWAYYFLNAKAVEKVRRETIQLFDRLGAPSSRAPKNKGRDR